MLLLRWLINTLALLIVANLLPGFHFDTFYNALITALVLGLVNVLVKPILVLLTLPVTILSLGLFLFVINALMLWLASSIVKGFTIENFGTALAAAIFLWLISLITNLVKSLANRDKPTIQ